MGTNRRYADAQDRRINNLIAERNASPSPDSLTQEELDLEHHPILKSDAAVPVRVWVTMALPSTSVQVEAKAVAWTDRAVKVEWTAQAGVMRSAWVWASACEHRDRLP